MTVDVKRMIAKLPKGPEFKVEKNSYLTKQRSKHSSKFLESSDLWLFRDKEERMSIMSSMSEQI